MANHYDLPHDLYGFSIEELRKILLPVRRTTRVRLTNREYSYDMLAKFKVKGITGQWRLVAPSKKKLDQAFFQIKEARRKRALAEQPTPTGKGVISVPIVDKAQPYGFGVGRFMEPLKTKKKGGDIDGIDGKTSKFISTRRGSETKKTKKGRHKRCLILFV